MVFFRLINPHFVVLFFYVATILLARHSLSYQEENIAPSRSIIEGTEESTLPSTLPYEDPLKGEKGNGKRKEVEPTLDPSSEAKKNKKQKKNEANGIEKKKKKKMKKKKKKTSIPASTNIFPSIDALISLPAISKNHPFTSLEIKEGCKNADYPNECVSSMLALDSTEASGMALFESSVEALKQALDVVRATSLKKDMGVTGKALVVCQEVYEGALSDLEGAMKAVKKNDNYKADLKLGAVITDVDTCKESIGRSGLGSELEQANMVVAKLAANAISLASAALHFNVE